jgi:hypothetical protein
MLGTLKVFGGVLVLRRVAAAHMTAAQAQAQVNPGVTQLEALLAAVSTRGDRVCLLCVGAFGVTQLRFCQFQWSSQFPFCFRLERSCAVSPFMSTAASLERSVGSARERRPNTLKGGPKLRGFRQVAYNHVLNTDFFQLEAAFAMHRGANGLVNFG